MYLTPGPSVFLSTFTLKYFLFFVCRCERDLECDVQLSGLRVTEMILGSTMLRYPNWPGEMNRLSTQLQTMLSYWSSPYMVSTLNISNIDLISI